jgi:hypothetical protein
MSTSPTPPPAPARTGSVALEFLKRLATILGASLGVVVVAALALGRLTAFGFSNLLFWASLIVLGISVLPAVAELGAGFSSMSQAFANKDTALKSVVTDRHEKRDRWLNTSILYGAAGIILFILSYLFASLVSGF